MKKLATILCLLVVLDIGVHLWSPSVAHAQSTTGAFEAGQVVSSISACQWTTGATVTNGVSFCFLNTGTVSTSGMYFALNGSTTWNPLVPAAQTAGVTSFNGRTGAVTLTDPDIQATGLKIATTVTSTAVSTPQ